mmetsp:Transcript_13353/g.22238  ORF Transcript_13353/g.22238 Transcript_13353/m.22238 type:complete len:151 (+) Transcript_13353:1-453(+)
MMYGNEMPPSQQPQHKQQNHQSGGGGRGGGRGRGVYPHIETENRFSSMDVMDHTSNNTGGGGGGGVGVAMVSDGSPQLYSRKGGHATPIPPLPQSLQASGSSSGSRSTSFTSTSSQQYSQPPQQQQQQQQQWMGDAATFVDGSREPKLRR